MATSDLKTSKTLTRTWTTPQNVKRPYFTFRQKGQHPSPYPSSTRFMLTSEIFGIVRHFEHNFQLFSEKSTASINFTSGQLLRIQLAIFWVRDQRNKTFWCLFSITLMRLGSQD